MFLISITWGGVQYPWSGCQTFSPLILGIIIIVLFVTYEFYLIKFVQAHISSSNPTPLLADRPTRIGYLLNILYGVIIYILLYYMLEYF